MKEIIKPFLLSSMFLSSPTIAEDKLSLNIKEYLSKYESHVKIFVNKNLNTKNKILWLGIEFEKYDKWDLNQQIISTINDVKNWIDWLFPKWFCCRWKWWKVIIKYTYKF